MEAITNDLKLMQKQRAKTLVSDCSDATLKFHRVDIKMAGHDIRNKEKKNSTTTHGPSANPNAVIGGSSEVDKSTIIGTSTATYWD